ncbi:MAG TPA: hypothetical protein VMJ10_34095 [Kofleriaceae bacterium]|nr:hypothetical protein [Kofleriaceae bacterium]
MKKQDDNTRDEIAHDWRDLVVALRDVIDGGLNTAARISSHEFEWDAIENIREFVYDWLDGRPAHFKIADLLLVLRIILAEVEIELGIDSAELLEPLSALLDVPSFRPAVIRLPGADSHEKPTVVIRRVARHRNAAAPFISLAA